MGASESHHERLSELFLRACELPENDRESFLMQECDGDEALLSELRELLAHDPGTLASDDAKLDSEVVRDAIQMALPAESSGRVGGYELLGKLGEGGMGIVYRARQQSPEREVALKVVPTGFAHPESLRRFEIEAELLGRLRHPGIAQIFEAGVDRDGEREQPFFAMELIEGRSISDWARAEHPTTEQRLELLVEIAEAISHAHQNGVIHRDLKPSNILVDEAGRARILDFGVARALEDSPAETALTRTGQLVGTLPYMSPEQAGGDPLAVDTRTDVYSIGVVAYELLCGKLPLDLIDVSLVEAARRIRDEEPTSLGRHSRVLRGDIETIVAMAMSKDKERRYASISAFAQDLRRVLAHEPISARPPSTLYQLSRLAKRHRALATGVTIALLALLVGFGAAVIEARRANREAERAGKETVRANEEAARTKAALEESEGIVDYLSGLLQAVHPAELGREVLVADVLELAPQRIEQLKVASPTARARIHEAVGRAWQALGRSELAAESLEQSLEVFEAEYGEDDPRTIATRSIFALSLAQNGEDTRALDEVQIAHEQAVAVFGEESMEAIDLWAMHGGIEQNLGRIEEAHAKLSTCVDVGARIAPNDERHLEHMQTLAGLERESGRFEEGLDWMRKAYERSTELHGPEHWQTLSLAAGLGLELYSNAQFEEAVELLEPTRVRLLDIHGDEHLLYLQATEHLGLARLESGDFEQANELLEETVATNTELHGERAAVTLTSKRYALQLYTRTGDGPRALRVAQELVEAFEEVHGPNHPDTIEALQALGGIHFERGENMLAERFLTDAVERAREHLPPSNPTRVQASVTLATLRRNQGQPEAALALLEEIEQDGEDMFGDIAITYWHSQALRGAILSDLERFDEGLAILRKSTAAHDAAIGADSPMSLQLHEALGRALLRSGDTNGAIEVFSNARGKALESVGYESDLSLRLTASTAECIQASGDLDRSAELIEEHLERSGGDLPERNPRGVMLLTRLATIYDAAERTEDSLRIRRQSLEALRIHYGAQHANVWIASYNLARAEFHAGEHKRAEELLRGGLEALPVAGLGPEWNARFSIDLAAVLQGMERNEEALEILKASREVTADIQSLDAAWVRGLDKRIEKASASRDASASDNP